MRKQGWKKWVTLIVAAGMLFSQLGTLSVKAEEEQSAEAVMESVEEPSSESEAAEPETVEESAVEDEEETSEYEDEPVEGENSEIPGETEKSGVVEERNGETEPAQESQSEVSAVAEPEMSVEEAGQGCPEFFYTQDFSQQGVRVSIQAKEGVVRAGTSVQITLLEQSDMEALEEIVRDKIDEIVETRRQEEKDGGRSIFETYSNLEAKLEKSYGFQITMSYADAEGNTHIICPEENEAIQVTIEMLNSEELPMDEMHLVETFSLMDGMPAFFAERENAIPSLYSLAVVQYSARADYSIVAAQQKAWEIINTYADPEYHMNDPYKKSMTEAQYEELRQAALAATTDCVTQYDKIRAITGFVADRIYYDYPFCFNQISGYIDPYDVFTQKRAICSGYARLMRTMLISIGIPCINTEGNSHEYNVAYDSQQKRWIFTDATWCSANYIHTVNGEAVWYRRQYNYNYFDLKPEEIALLSNHEVYIVCGLKGSQDQIYYELVAPPNNWHNMDWRIAIEGLRGQNATNVVFEEQFAGVPVTEIVVGAFNGCSGLTGNMVLPSSLTEIGESAFNGCSGLTGNLELPSGVTKIGDGAFYGCSGLTGNLELPSGVIEIGAAAFDGCSGLTGLVLPSSLTKIGDGAFDGCSGLMGNLELPSGVTQIGGYAFFGCSSLTGNLKLPSGLIEIGDRAFSECSGLMGLELPSGLAKIGDYAFERCSGLTGNLELPSGLTEINEYAFYNCSGLTGLVLPSSLTKIDRYAFNGCSGLTGDLELPSGVTKIGESAFSGCSGLTGNLELPSGVTEIGDGAFTWCSGLTGLVLPSGVTEIGEHAFTWCSGLTGNLELPSGVTKIGDGAFYGCSGLTGNLELPSGVTKIGDNVFGECSGLTNLVLPSGLTEIGESAFNGCSGLTGNLKLPSSVTKIGESAFNGCSGLTGNLELPSGLTEIGDGVFGGCSGLTGNLVLPLGVTKIGRYAFNGCSGLTGNLELPSSLTEIGDYAFDGCSNFAGIDLSSVDTSNIQNIEDIIISCNNLETIKSPQKMGTEIIRLPAIFVDSNGRETRELSREFCNTLLTRKEKSKPTPTPIVVDEQTKVQVSSFVSRMYTIALGREAEEKGLKDWTNRLLSHEIDGAGIANGFIMSDEFTNRSLSDEYYVDTLYRTFFNREADQGGRANWLSELAAGKSRGYVLSGFVNSTEFDNLCDSYGIARGTMREDGSPVNAGIRQFVERCYTKVLGRPGEKAGVEDWTNRIATGQMSAEDVAKSFFFSDEYTNKNTTNETFVETLYQTFMDRASDPAGKSDWVGRLSAGASREEVLEGFSRSKEFAGILAGYGL